MSIEDLGDERRLYNQRIAVLPGDPPVAYRPGRALLESRAGETPEQWEAAIEAATRLDVTVTTLFEDCDADDPEWLDRWLVIEGDFSAPEFVEQLVDVGVLAQLDIVYFANGSCVDVCPPHPALASAIAANPWGANPWGANPWGANPWGANPWGANPWGANPWGANPWGANAEQLNLVATGKPPVSTAMPALGRELPERQPPKDSTPVTVGILDSGIAGLEGDEKQLRPELLDDFARVSGELDVPSKKIKGKVDDYLDPVAGHGTFIAGIIEQLTPGCRMWVAEVFHPGGDVDISTLGKNLRRLVRREPPWRPHIVNLSLGGTGTTENGLFERLIKRYHTDHDVIFVASAGNEGTCIEQYPAALREVIAVAALGPSGPAPWSNYGPWVNACAPGTNLVSAFFAEFNGPFPLINGVDPDDFKEWATWTGTSFAAPVVVAALARELALGVSADEAVRRVVRAPHLARLVNLGTIVNR